MDVILDANGVDCRTASAGNCQDNELGCIFFQYLMGNIDSELTEDQGVFVHEQLRDLN